MNRPLPDDPDRLLAELEGAGPLWIAEARSYR